LESKEASETAIVEGIQAVADLAQYNRDVYERIWGYARFHPPERTPWWPVLSELSAAAPMRLEVGPGLWPRLPMEGTHVVDLSDRALDGLAAHGAIVHGGRLEQVAFSKSSFDLVGIFEVLEHVEDDEALLAEIARITKPGGILTLSVPLGRRHWTAFDEYAGHVRRYEPDELQQKLTRGGFVLERFEVRPMAASKIVANLATPFCRWFPRLSVWATERVFLPIACRWKLDWREAGEWNRLAARAADGSLLCRRT
jgi:SAM-dependent methyltransferase